MSEGNKNSVWVTIGATNHSEGERQQNDYYATQPEAIDKLLKAERPYRNVWECACGQGHLSERLKEHGFKVYSTDLIDRGYKGAESGIDFLKLKTPPVQLTQFDIVTNPPYKYAKEFVQKALDLLSVGRKVFMFLKLTFLEGQDRYNDLFSKTPPQTLYVCSARVNCAKNGDFDKYKSSALAYGWYVFEKGYTGDTKIKWI